jgi:hypothetical protein
MSHKKNPADTVEQWPIEKLIPYAKNSRTHSEEQIAQIAASIKEWGFTTAVLVDEGGGIIAGHGRLMAARRLGMDAVPVMVAKGWSEAQKRAYVIADNKLALNAGWDNELLALELSELGDLGFDVELTGFSDEEIKALMPEQIPEGLTDEDSVPEMPVDPVTVAGDVWVLGHHRLMCGDSTNIDAVDRLMDGKSWDVCVFDPPYEIEELYDQMPTNEDGKRLVVMWDFKRFAKAAVSAVAAGWTPQYEFIWDCVQSWYTPNRPLARHKAVGVFGDDPHFDTEASLIVDGKNRGSTRTVANTRGSYNYTPLAGAKHIATVEAFANTAQSSEHAHGKPVSWVRAILAGIRANTVLDMFGGGGSTLIACEGLGCKVFTMELSPAQCDVIIKRWQDFTGKNAAHAESGKTFDEISNGKN